MSISTVNTSLLGGAVSAAQLTSSMSGTLFTVSSSAVCGITLPTSIQPGCSYDFIRSTASTNAWSITGAAGTLRGEILLPLSGGGTFPTLVSSTSSATLTVAAGNIGDSLSVISDGTNWNISGHARGTGAAVAYT